MGLSINEVFGNPNYYYKNNMPDNYRNTAAHDDYYRKIVLFLGYDKIKRHVPYKLISDNPKEKTIVNSRNRAFNDLPIENWDIAATINWDKHIFWDKNITCWSESQVNSILKQCARMMLYEYRNDIPQNLITKQMQTYLDLGWTYDESYDEAMYDLVQLYPRKE